VRLLAAPTVDGIVFRVDMRLRPFGESGPLASGFSSFEDYLGQHGRDWERYAWVKARPITAPEAYVELYRDAVRPFVFRRYLDFGVFESLREMKQLIEKQVIASRDGGSRQARAGRHPRDRVHRAGVPADPGRPGPPVAESPDASRRCRCSPTGGCCQRARCRRSRCRVSPPAHAREPACR
jgi:hypothetical protein